MRRCFAIGLVALVAGGCEIPSGVTTPTTSGTADKVSYSASGEACPTPAPTPDLPFAVFGHPQVVSAQGCPSSPAPDVITPSFAATPQTGPAPLTSLFSMCGSTDPDPLITLHYAVTYGDGGSDASQNGCSFSHTYTAAGTYTAQECVWDEIPSHAPGICKTFTVTANTVSTSDCQMFVSCADFFEGGAFVALGTMGTTAACGNPLTVRATQGGALLPPPSGVQSAKCPPGNSCEFFFPTASGQDVLLTSPNASGSIVVTFGEEFGSCG